MPGDGDLHEAENASLAGPVVDSALEETRRLVSDLADALATQTARLATRAEEASQPEQARRLIGALKTQAERMQRQCTELRDLLAPVVPHDSGAAASGSASANGSDEPAAAPSLTRRGGFDGDRRGPAETLAIELRMQGDSREKVEHELADTFGIADAKAIVDAVFDDDTPA